MAKGTSGLSGLFPPEATSAAVSRSSTHRWFGRPALDAVAQDPAEGDEFADLQDLLEQARRVDGVLVVVEHLVGQPAGALALQLHVEGVRDPGRLLDERADATPPAVPASSPVLRANSEPWFAHMLPPSASTVVVPLARSRAIATFG
jgi:hypothetical protein